MLKSQTGAAILLAVLLQAPAFGQTDATGQTSAGNKPAAASYSEPSRWQLGVGLGYGVRTNPLVAADDIPIIVDIDIAWFGDRFFFDNGDLGLTFADNEYMTTSLVGRVNSDRVFFGRTNTRFVSVGGLSNAPLSERPDKIEAPDRDYAGELGVELLTDGLWGQLQLSAFHDVSNTHGGYEIAADYSYGWRNQRLAVQPSVGFSYKSADLNNYYWGVRPAESGSGVPGYQAGAGVNGFARLQFSYQMTRNWNLSVVTEVERLNDEAAASPIVGEQYIYGFFAGFGYRFR